MNQLSNTLWDAVLQTQNTAPFVWVKIVRCGTSPPKLHSQMDLDPSMERMRALLSSYYGVVEDTETAVEESKDIDKPTFDMVRVG